MKRSESWIMPTGPGAFLRRVARGAAPRRVTRAPITRIGALLGTLLLMAGGCEPEPELGVPSAEEVESYYTITAESEVEMNGNVAVVEVYRGSYELRRGGNIWAKVGPYVYLFSEATRDLFQDHPGLAAVRVITRAPNGDEVARATLPRTALNSVTWKRALNISGHARREGGRRVTRMEDLIEWGEDHTDYRYSPEYVR